VRYECAPSCGATFTSEKEYRGHIITCRFVLPGVRDAVAKMAPSPARALYKSPKKRTPQRTLAFE
jgi:hypothetical protein